MFNQSDSSDTESIDEAPRLIVVKADIEYTCSITDRVIASISKRPKLVLSPFERCGIFHSKRSREVEEVDKTTYDSFKTGPKLASSIIEENESISTQNIEKDINLDEKIEKPGVIEKSKIQEESPDHKQSQEEKNENRYRRRSQLSKALKIQRKKRNRKADKRKQTKVVYGTSLLEYLKELQDPEYQAQIRKECEERKIFTTEEDEFAKLEKLLKKCDQLEKKIKETTHHVKNITQYIINK